jgi:hypothetical protein
MVPQRHTYSYQSEIFSTYQLLFVLSFIKGCVHLSFDFFFKMICYPHYLLASPKNICMHNSTPEYAFTANISTISSSPKSWFSHVDVHNSIPEYASTASILKPFQKKFLKK